MPSTHAQQETSCVRRSAKCRPTQCSHAPHRLAAHHGHLGPRHDEGEAERLRVVPQGAHRQPHIAAQHAQHERRWPGGRVPARLWPGMPHCDLPPPGMHLVHAVEFWSIYITLQLQECVQSMLQIGLNIPAQLPSGLLVPPSSCCAQYWSYAVPACLHH
jgi:hypothetical protein